MIGYHYTTKSAYEAIRTIGLRPAPCTRAELAELGMNTQFFGTYVWDYKLSPRSELGIVLYVLSQHSETEIVRLRVEYPAHHRLGRYDIENHAVQAITFYHSQSLGDYELIDDKPSSHVIAEYVPPKNVTLEKEFNLMDLIFDGNYKEQQARRTDSVPR